MSGPRWTYPAIIASMNAAQKPSRGAIRKLVRRIRTEAFPRPCDPAKLRMQVRRTVRATLQADLRS
jgi:hypothetical protein